MANEFTWIVRNQGGGFLSEWNNEGSAASAAQAAATQSGNNTQYSKVGPNGVVGSPTVVTPMFTATCPSCKFRTNEYGTQKLADDTLALHRQHKKH